MILQSIQLIGSFSEGTGSSLLGCISMIFSHRTVVQSLCMLNPSKLPACLDIDALKATRAEEIPFRHLVVENFVRPAVQPDLRKQFPFVCETGSFPLPCIRSFSLPFNGRLPVPFISPSLPFVKPNRPIFFQLITELRSPEFRKIVEEKLGISLDGTTLEISTRNITAQRDGAIRCGSRSLQASGIIHLEKEWLHGSNGSLRVLRAGTDKADFVREIPPTHGTLFLFKKSDRSFLGYEDAFERLTKRRTIQFSWFHFNRFHKVVRSIYMGLIKRADGAFTNFLGMDDTAEIKPRPKR